MAIAMLSVSTGPHPRCALRSATIGHAAGEPRESALVTASTPTLPVLRAMLVVASACVRDGPPCCEKR